MTKKILFVTTTQDVSPFTDEYINETMIKLIRQTADASGTTVEVHLVKEEIEEKTAEAPISLVDRLLQSVRNEFKESDERPRD